MSVIIDLDAIEKLKNYVIANPLSWEDNVLISSGAKPPIGDREEHRLFVQCVVNGVKYPYYKLVYSVENIYAPAFVVNFGMMPEKVGEKDMVKVRRFSCSKTFEKNTGDGFEKVVKMFSDMLGFGRSVVVFHRDGFLEVMEFM